MSKFRPNNTKAAKLSNEQVYDMRQKYADGWSQAELCQHFDVAINTVGRIVRGESRRNVPQVIGGDEIAESAARMMAIPAPGLAKLKVEVDKVTKPTGMLNELIDFEGASKFGVTEDRK